MTEDQAKKKWCPETRLHVNEMRTEPYNRYLHNDEMSVNIPDASKCIASDCMMWRELKTAFKEGEDSLSLDELNRRETKGEMRVLGYYCGLGGKP